MAKDVSFDIVSKLEMQEVDNAIHQATKEIETRFDFKGSKSSIERSGETLTLSSDDEYKLSQVLDVLQSKLVKRDVSLKSLKPGKVEPASGGTVRQVFTLQQGIDQDAAKSVTKLIHDAKLKVQASIQGDKLRITGKKRDDLQEAIAFLKKAEFPLALQFNNFRD